jgi:all-trans-retinol 13,14-reductase
LDSTVEQVRNGPIPIFTDADEKAIDLTNPREQTWRRAMGVLIHPLGDYACQPRDSAFLAHGVTAAYYMDGASYTVGATQNVSRGAAQFVLNNGGNVLTQARVLSIILNRSKTKAVGVRVCPTAAFNAANENASAVDPTMITYLYAKNIVAATSVYNLYNTLLKPESPWLSEKFEITRKFEPSYGHVFLFVCLKGSPKDLDIPKTNMWYFNS